ncbi:hypothetical protein ACFFIS_10440 [Virgibacillus soli]|uniref:DUF3139 domain-containing protein n=1 Tax=Paracerasibacillus soli TaxID=480284 RepID=A0ABU5CM87_9BACI|nr:hypothetical protein [Virgibacillus soli]MDY0407482.1 hypothetical protein [Virgibacillus soli]
MKKRILIIGIILFIAFIILPPILAPIVHDNHSPKSALREAIYKNGHPYQSFFALIFKGDVDETYGQRYHVFWYDFDSPTGDTATICYTKEFEKGKYDVSCGTGP